MEHDTYTWLTVRQVAQLIGTSERYVQRLCKNQKYLTKATNGRGRGGKTLLIALESMTTEEQMSFLNSSRAEENDLLNGLTQKEREKAGFKLRVVMEYKQFKTTPHSHGRMNQFIETFNRENPAAAVTRTQVNRWEHSYDEQGIRGLYDGRGSHNRGNTSIPPEAWDTFYSEWFHNPRSSLQQCYEMTCQKHKEQFPQMPSIQSFRRQMEKIPQGVKILRNKGKKGFDDNCMPHIDVEYEALASNEQWVADHHVFDVLVKDERGRIFRPWLSAWLDRRSRYIVGYEINSCTPNSDIVLSSFAKACIKCGIPETVLLDNGKDFKAYDLFNNSNAVSVAHQMGIRVTNAIVKNAKAKPIERYFRTIEEKYFAMLPCYIAGKPHLRPEKMSMTNRKLKLKGLCIPYIEFLETAELVIQEMNNRPHRGRGMSGCAPYEVYTQNFVRPARMVKDDDVLHLLLQRTSRPLKVGRNGIRLKASGYDYSNSLLFDLIGKEVYARYNSDDLSKVFIYDLQDRFICTARCNELAQLGTQASMQLIREYNHRKKEIRERLKELIPAPPDYTITDYLNDRKAEYKEYDVKHDLAAVPAITSRHKDKKQILEAEKEESVPIGTIPFSDHQKRREKVDQAYYEFIKKAGGGE